MREARLLHSHCLLFAVHHWEEGEEEEEGEEGEEEVEGEEGEGMYM